MLVGLLTPWNERSWLCDYVFNVKKALEQQGVGVRVVACNRLGHSANYPDDSQIVRGAWSRGGPAAEIDSMEVALQGCDVVHAQFVRGLWDDNMIYWLYGATKPVVATFHDVSDPLITQEYVAYAMMTSRLVAVDRRFSDPNWFGTFFGVDAERLPDPAVSKAMNVLLLGPHCDVGVSEQAIALANDQLAGSVVLNPVRLVKHWVDRGVLRRHLEAAHMVVSYYPESDNGETAYWPIYGAASGRPLLVSNTDWFRRYSDTNVYKAWDVKDLADGLTFSASAYGAALADAKPYSKSLRAARSWHEVAKMHMQVYVAAMEKHEHSSHI